MQETDLLGLGEPEELISYKAVDSLPALAGQPTKVEPNVVDRARHAYTE